ncbi:MAG: hypothetical protein AB7J28_12255 [Hyphomonadaceae bacterium]
MAFIQADALKIALRSALEESGWRVERVESAADAWWMNELWRLQSLWRPRGAEVFVSFIGDPGWDGPHPPKRIGNVGVGRCPAEDYSGRGVDRFNAQRELDAMVRCAARLRDEIERETHTMNRE